MFDLILIVIVGSFVGCIGALYIFGWLHAEPELNWPNVKWPKRDWSWLSQLFPAELLIGLVTIMLIVAAFVAILRTGENLLTNQLTLAAADSVVAVLLGLASIAAFLLATRRWWKKSPHRAWTPFLLGWTWFVTASYLLYVAVVATWSGNWPWGVFNALGAAASAIFALPLLVAAIFVWHTQRKARLTATLADATLAE